MEFAEFKRVPASVEAEILEKIHGKAS